jgi:hypothetical protein
MLDTMLDLVKQARRPGRSTEQRLEFLERACAIAKDAAPYLHPRLGAVMADIGGEVRHSGQVSLEIPDAAAERILAATGIDVRQPVGSRRRGTEEAQCWPPRLVHGPSAFSGAPADLSRSEGGG